MYLQSSHRPTLYSSSPHTRRGGSLHYVVPLAAANQTLTDSAPKNATERYTTIVLHHGHFPPSFIFLLLWPRIVGYNLCTMIDVLLNCWKGRKSPIWWHFQSNELKWSLSPGTYDFQTVELSSVNSFLLQLTKHGKYPDKRTEIPRQARHEDTKRKNKRCAINNMKLEELEPAHWTMLRLVLLYDQYIQLTISFPFHKGKNIGLSSWQGAK